MKNFKQNEDEEPKMPALSMHLYYAQTFSAYKYLVDTFFVLHHIFWNYINSATTQSVSFWVKDSK